MALVSRYIRETSLIDSRSLLSLPDSSRIRKISQNEAQQTAQLIQKRNVFSRHSREKDFYYLRALSFSGKTVIEIFKQGQPNDIADEASSDANLLEALALLSTTLAVQRKKFMQKLGISMQHRTEIDLILGPNLRYIRSRSRSAPKCVGLPFDRTAVQRFHRLGFSSLYKICQSNSGHGARLGRSVKWLLESRCEPSIETALVKTTIALESLLILSDSDKLKSSLSERAAFLLSPDPNTRKRIASLLGHLYNARSNIVHGSLRRHRFVQPQLLEACERLAVLLMLVIVTNFSLWPDEDSFHIWLQEERWRAPTQIQLPFAPICLYRALALADKS